MADTGVSKTPAARRVGSNPTLGTKNQPKVYYESGRTPQEGILAEGTC